MSLVELFEPPVDLVPLLGALAVNVRLDFGQPLLLAPCEIGLHTHFLEGVGVAVNQQHRDLHSLY